MWVRDVANNLPSSSDDDDEHVPLIQVDAHNIVPVW